MLKTQKCAYCGEEVPAVKNLPKSWDENGWNEIALYHNASCNFVRTKNGWTQELAGAASEPLKGARHTIIPCYYLEDLPQDLSLLAKSLGETFEIKKWRGVDSDGNIHEGWIVYAFQADENMEPTTLFMHQAVITRLPEIVDSHTLISTALLVWW